MRPLSRFLIENSGLYEEATDIIVASRRSSIRPRYPGQMYRFSQYCLQKNINPAQASFKYMYGILNTVFLQKGRLIFC